MCGLLCPVESDVAHLALGLGDLGGLDGAAGIEDPIGVVVVVDFVELPKVQVVGAQAAQALVELLQGAVAGPVADLRHEEDVVAMVGQSAAIAALAEAVAIVPGGVEERDAVVQRRADDALGFRVGHRGPRQVAAAEGDDRDSIRVAAEGPRGQRVVRARGHRRTLDHALGRVAPEVVLAALRQHLVRVVLRVVPRTIAQLGDGIGDVPVGARVG